jgi:hypothetical protein
MDDIDKIPLMIEFAESVALDETISWLKQIWKPSKSGVRR